MNVVDLPSKDLTTMQWHALCPPYCLATVTTSTLRFLSSHVLSRTCE